MDYEVLKISWEFRFSTEIPVILK